MDELRRKFEKFCGTKPILGSQHMRELLCEIFSAADAIKSVSLYADRKRTLRMLNAVEEMRDAYQREDFDALGRNVMLYGVLAL